mgnify:CR=1 FL=1
MPSREGSPDRDQGLTALRHVCRTAADDLVAVLAMLGDRETQGALDAYLDHLLDALRMLDAEAGELWGQGRRPDPGPVAAPHLGSRARGS